MHNSKDIIEEHIYNEETGKSKYIIKYDGLVFVGKAKCHPDDVPFANEKAGAQIARSRAIIKMFKYEIRKLSYQTKALKDFYNSVCGSKTFSRNPWLKKKFMDEIDSYGYEIIELQQSIETVEKSLKNYLNLKAELYKKLLKNRDKNN